MHLNGFILLVSLAALTYTENEITDVNKAEDGIVDNPVLVKLPFSFPRGMENTPVVYEGRPLLVNNFREPTSTAKDMYLFIEDLTTGEEIARFGIGFSFVSAIVIGHQGINNTDADLFEWEGNTYVYYGTGDQETWGTIRVAMHSGPMKPFLESYFPDGVPMIRFDARQGRYLPQRDATGAVDANAAKRQEWFRQAKFGYIVHYSLFSLEPHEGLNPLELNLRMRHGDYPLPEYERFADRFQASRFDAANLVSRLQAAGGRYVIFIAKEHDGFCLFDTKLTDYNAVKRGAGRDLIDELAKAARAGDMKLFLYYSMLDEHHRDYRANLPQYVETMHGQIRELCSNYGPIDGIWFDGEWDHPIEAWRSPELVDMIRQLQPDAVVNDRLGKGLRGQTRLCDFYTREQLHEIRQTTDFERNRSHPWEACMTIGESWVYSQSDTELKTSAELIRRIVDVASRGGNLVLNVPLTADGEIPGEYDARLKDIGEWMSRSGESVYGTCGSPFASLPAGKCTMKENRLYVHLESHPGPTVKLPNLVSGITRARFLQTGEILEYDDARKIITMPASLPCSAVSTIVLDLDSPVRVK
jgi:alpha-L-fucosidase